MMPSCRGDLDSDVCTSFFLLAAICTDTFYCKERSLIFYWIKLSLDTETTSVFFFIL